MSWKTVLERLWEIIPPSSNYVKIKNNFVPDLIFKSVGDVELSPFVDWEEFSDQEIWKKVCSGVSYSNEEFYVVDENVFSYDLEPSLISGAELAGYINGYLDANKICFFNGDVILIAKEKALIFVFHHEGAYTWIGSQGHKDRH